MNKKTLVIGILIVGLLISPLIQIKISLRPGKIAGAITGGATGGPNDLKQSNLSENSKRKTLELAGDPKEGAPQVVSSIVDPGKRDRDPSGRVKKAKSRIYQGLQAKGPTPKDSNIKVEMVGPKTIRISSGTYTDNYGQDWELKEPVTVSFNLSIVNSGNKSVGYFLYPRIDPFEEINSTVAAPPSKSYNQRALLISSLAEGRSRLENISLSEDSKLMIESLKKFGTDIQMDGRVAKVNPGNIKPPSSSLSLDNCGTCMRFLTSYSLLSPRKIVLRGNKRMKERPIGGLVGCLEDLGAEVEYLEKEGYPPLTVSGALGGGKSKIDARESSQYLSSVLMVSPYADSKVTLEVLNLASNSFVDITLDIMDAFGAEISYEDYQSFTIPSGRYEGRDYIVEGDYSNASYFFAAAAITGGRIKVKNLNPDTVQGAADFLDILERMGCDVESSADGIEVKGPDSLNSVSVNLSRMPDVAQTLAVIAAFADGTTEIKGVPNLRIKETDRIKATVRGLRRMGIDAKEMEDGMIVKGGEPQGACIDTYGDHRMAMSFAVAGLKVPGIEIKNEGCVRKSFPGFFEKLESLD